jgi:hypothetical protein
VIASILHDQDGKIIAITHKVDPRHFGSKFESYGMVPQTNQLLTEIDIPIEHEARSLRELHDLFRIDVQSRTLVKK